MAALDAVLTRIDANLNSALQRLFALIAIPSISTDPAYAQDCRQAAEWLVDELRSLGFDTSLYPTPGHPMVVAKARGGREGAPHLLFYGHYDVQPPDPLDLWETPPFAPRLTKAATGTQIVGRGVADDKGQLMTFVEACRAYQETAGALPCDVTILLEGEEESGSTSLPGFLAAHRDELAADLVLVCDTGMWDRKTPAITTMLRGLVLEEVVIHAADRDLHSGMFGGAAVNPIHVLAKIIADLHDENHRITLPGFYDGVAELPPDIAAQWRHLPQDGPRFSRRCRPLRAGRRDRPQYIGNDLGAADLRCERHHRRLYGQGLEDGAAGAGFRQIFIPPRRPTRSRKGRGGLPQLRTCAPAGRLPCRLHLAWRLAGASTCPSVRTR